MKAILVYANGKTDLREDCGGALWWIVPDKDDVTPGQWRGGLPPAFVVPEESLPKARERYFYNATDACDTVTERGVAGLAVYVERPREEFTGHCGRIQAIANEIRQSSPSERTGDDG
jgi:hypothetical protein